MPTTEHRLGDIRVELLSTDDGTFIGLGRAWIGQTLVRSGRLPLAPAYTTFSGWELDHIDLLDVHTSATEIRVELAPMIRPMATKAMRDHSFDPIHEVGDWDRPRLVRNGNLALVITPAADQFGGVAASGFAYQWAFSAAVEPLYFLLDRASWELGGDIAGATAVSQSSCSDPVAVFAADTYWTTEGLIHWDPDMPNPVMTHNLPRWASHQAFDFQWRDGAALLGTFARVDLIRTLLRREPGAAELKVFDKYIFDQTAEGQTVAKSILLASGVDTPTQMRNLWTWTFDAVHRRARAEYGLAQEPTLPRISANYWQNFNFDSYYKDLMPAAIDIGVKQIFIDNANKSAMSEKGIGNMCCGHEYEIADSLGGPVKMKELVDRAARHGIQIMSWTNNDQAYSSPINRSERDERGWFIKMEDTRLKYGGAYTNVFTILDNSQEGPRRYWIDCLKKTRETTGLNGYLYDSFYNLGFMPVNYAIGSPRTMWRGTLEAFKELQDADIHFLIESFGPFGQPQHGCPKSYSVDRCWVCYEINVGNDYSTVPTGAPTYMDPRGDHAETLHYIFAHKTLPQLPLFRDKVRIDARFTDAHRQAIADYHAVMANMHDRYLQEDDKAVVWHDATGATATIWAFAEKSVALAGTVTDVTTGQTLPAAPRYTLLPQHTYTVTGGPLPTAI